MPINGQIKVQDAREIQKWISKWVNIVERLVMINKTTVSLIVANASQLTPHSRTTLIQTIRQKKKFEKRQKKIRKEATKTLEKAAKNNKTAPHHKSSYVDKS